MNRIILFLFLCFISHIVKAQTWEFANDVNGNFVKPHKSVLDQNNNTYILSTFQDTLILENQEIYSHGTQDLALLKYSSDGKFLWVKQIGSTKKTFAGGIAIDENDNIYITGSYSDTCYFDSNFLLSTGSYDIFLASYTNEGVLTNYGTIASDNNLQFSNEIAIDKNQKITITGFFNSSMTIGLSDDQEILSGNEYYSHFISNHNLNGTLNWVKFFLGQNNSTRFSFIEPIENGYYFGGIFVNTLDLDIGSLESQNNSFDAFIYKTDFNGTGEWVRKIYGSELENMVDITVDDYQNLYILGNYQSSPLYFDSTATSISTKNQLSGGNDAYICKYNRNGNLLWSFSKGSSDMDGYKAISINNETLYASGYFTNQIIFNQDTLNSLSGNDFDAFLAALNSIGDPISAIGIFGSGYNEIGTIALIDENNNGYIVGTFESSQVAIGDSIFYNSHPNNKNLFIAKYSHPFEAVFTNESNPTCNGATDGMLTTTPYFGVPPYTYSWSHDAGLNDSVAANLSAGTYTVTITDSRDSTAIGSATVGQPQPILVDFDVTNTTCYNGNDGALDITVTGGNNEYDYTWDGGVGLEPKEEDQTGLYAGTYYLTITDQKNCTKLDTVEISQPGKIRFNPSITPSGEGLSNGAIDLTPEGGNPPYNFAWSGPSSFTETTEDVTGLAGGTYNVTITHDASCSADTSIFVPEENQFQIYISNVEHISCYGASDGSASVSVENESGLLAYTWYDSTKVNIVSEFAAASNLDSGKYYVRVEDQFPHVAWDSVVIQQPDSLYFSRFFRSQVQCNGENTGYIDVEIDGGTPVYTYQWAHGPTSENLTGLAASDEYYKVTVTDANGCTSADSGKILEPDPLLVTIDKQDPLCPGTLSGIATANASGGVQPYDYVWNDPGNQTEKQATALPAGNFTVTVTDFAGCIKTASTALNDPAPIQITSVDVTHINCHGSDNGSVSVDVTGGTGSYDYTWNHSSENSGTVNSLAPGDYSVIVTDANNCTPDTAFATITEPDTVIIDITTTQIDCHGQEEGEILINASGGSGSFTYEWGHTTSGFSELGGLAAGTYDVTVSDGQCPPFEYSLEISEPEALSVDIDTANATCHGDNDGAITISVTGGTGSYSYSWSHTATDTNRFTNLLAGNYSVTVSDGACPLLSYENIPVTQPDSFYIASIDSSHVSEFGARDGFIQVNMSGGIPPLRYSLNGGTVRETNAFNDLGPGMYTVVINDANQCGPVSTGPIEIKEPPSAISGVWKSNEISIFPNPARNTVYLRFQGLQEDIIQVRIVNVLGELIFDSTYRDVLQNNVLEINTEEFSTGTYFMIINNKRAPHPLIID